MDSEIALRAGSLLQNVKNCYPRHRLHDAILVATAQLHGHGLLTRRDGHSGLGRRFLSQLLFRTTTLTRDQAKCSIIPLRYLGLGRDAPLPAV